VGPPQGAPPSGANPGLISAPEAANRLARAILSDIRIYNEAKIREGIQKDTLFDLLAEELEEGRAHFASRVQPALSVYPSLYDRAIVDVLVYQSRRIPSSIW
jgi:hypothetical protein